MNLKKIIKQSLFNINMINSQSKGLKRNTIDKYYTKCEIVDKCVNIFKEMVQINDDDFY